MFDFSKCTPPITQVAGPWFRVHRTEKGAVFFGRNCNYRWDAPDKSYGVMYAGETWQAAFMESVLHDPHRKIIIEADLEKRSMALLNTTIPLRLVDLSDGRVLRELGLTSSDTQTFPYTTTQEISKAINTAGWKVHGIRYASRLDPDLACLALFDFPENMVSVHDLDLLVAPANQGLVCSILDQYKIGLIKP